MMGIAAVCFARGKLPFIHMLFRYGVRHGLAGEGRRRVVAPSLPGERAEKEKPLGLSGEEGSAVP